MEKMFVSFENPSETAEPGFDGVEPMRSKASTASYRCKLYRIRLEQGAASLALSAGLRFGGPYLQDPLRTASTPRP